MYVFIQNLRGNDSKWIFISTSISVLVRISIFVKREHDHGNSYKGKHFIATGKYGAGDGAKSSRSWSTLNTKGTVSLDIA